MLTVVCSGHSIPEVGCRTINIIFINYLNGDTEAPSAGLQEALIKGQQSQDKGTCGITVTYLGRIQIQMQDSTSEKGLNLLYFMK